MMFQVSHAFQIWVFLKSAGLGALTGLIYLIFVILRRSGLTKTAFVIVQDVVFFGLAGVASFMFIFEVNAGEVRFFILAGEAMGFCLIYLFPLREIGGLYNKIVLKLKAKTRKNKISEKHKKIQKNQKKLLH